MSRTRFDFQSNHRHRAQHVGIKFKRIFQGFDKLRLGFKLKIEVETIANVVNLVGKLASAQFFLADYFPVILRNEVFDLGYELPHFTVGELGFNNNYAFVRFHNTFIFLRLDTARPVLSGRTITCVYYTKKRAV